MPVKSNDFSVITPTMLSQTSWRPNYDIEAGLTETIEWIRANLSGYKLSQYNV